MLAEEYGACKAWQIWQKIQLQQLEQDTDPALPQRSFVICQIEKKDPLDGLWE